MGKKSRSSPPPAPNPAVTAQAQGAVNKETAIAQAILGHVNQVTPYGNVTYTRIGEESGTPRYQQTTTLTPDSQAALEAQQRLTGQLYNLAGQQYGKVASTLSQPFSFSGAPGASYDDLQAARKRAEEAVYGSMASRLDPRFAREEEAMRIRLANQGFSPGTEGYAKAVDEFSRAKTDAYQQALNQAITTGGAELSRDFGIDQANRQQWINEQTYLRNLPLNEVSALLGSGSVQGPQAYQYNAHSIQSPDLAGLTMANYQGQLNNYNQQLNAKNAMMGGLFGLGGILGAAGVLKYSDRRLKTNIHKVGKLDNGLPIYSFRYKWGGPIHIGLMAQDVEKVHPEAIKMVGKFKAVDYEKAVA